MDQFVGQIVLAGFNFAPAGWHLCDGSLLPISQYDALYNLIGTTYGGDGVSTFGLPDLRGRTAVGQGTGPNLGTYVMGKQGGAEYVIITSQNQRIQFPFRTVMEAKLVLTDKLIQEDLKARKSATS